MSNWIVKISRSKTARTLLPAMAGFLGYGGWAFFCNLMHGVKMGVQSGLVQGSLSFSITLVFNGVMEFLYKRLKSKLWSIIITIIGFVSVSFAVNTLAGTPEVLATIAPGSIIGSFYVYTYIKGLAAISG